LGRRQINLSVLENVEIGPAGAEGHCIARVDNQVVFVKFAAPGDVADIQITGKKKKFLEGRIKELHHASELRVNPVCQHYGICGGCKWQHLDYKNQLAFKQKQVVDSIERIGGIHDFEVLPILGSKNIYGYRNKLELTFSNKGWVEVFDRNNPVNTNALGFHIPGKFDKVIDIQHCHLMPEKVNHITLAVKAFCEENQYSYFDLRDQKGLMRNIMLRCNSKGEWMVLLAFSAEDSEKREPLLEFVKNKFPNVVSLVYVINNKRNDTLQDLEVICYSGQDHLTEKLGELEFKIRPQSFFQTNTKQAEVLYEIIKNFAQLSSSQKVYDLYTGTGSIALYVANNASRVIGIEYVKEAIEDAKENMAGNGIANCEFYAGDMKDILTTEFIQQHGKPDVVITDPPRDGMHPDVVKKLLEMEAEKIVYVSCNPATQARDAKLLDEKYKLIKIQPVDMFPHTHHVENVGLWQLK
jgi:23S rRNA (uracil1939-C5)-methyltransferase